MTTELNFGRDAGGYNAYAPFFAADNWGTLLAANTEQHFTVTGTYSRYVAVFSYQPGGAVWVANNYTAAVPSGSFAATTSQLNPAVRIVNQGDVLSFITADTDDYVGVSLYGIN
jgi:hypothetical protein